MKMESLLQKGATQNTWDKVYLQWKLSKGNVENLEKRIMSLILPRGYLLMRIRFLNH